MKILMINAVCGIGSTGRICAEQAERYEAEGHEVRIAYGRMAEVPEKYRHFGYRIGSAIGVRIHGVWTRLTDGHGFGSKAATRAFLKWAEAFSPDMLWLHNVHGYYINIEMLFAWIKKHPQMQVKWTLHDCWTFTGHCSHFSYVKCDKWKTGCFDCPQKGRYPASLIDRSRNNYLRKKTAFTGVKDMTILTPSEWLAKLARQSFLGCYPVEVLYNTIDETVFRPTPGDFRERYGLQHKKVVLGVASSWDDRKGLYDFYELRKRLDERYAIVLVGLKEQQISQLPEGILGIPRTNSPQELAALYTAADVFANPSYEETFGMTTVEALACGTQAIVYRDTACEEIVRLKGGLAVEQSVDALVEAAISVCEGRENTNE